MRPIFSVRFLRPKNVTLLLSFLSSLILILWIHSPTYFCSSFPDTKDCLEEEAGFPLAYGISVYKDGPQLLDLLDAIFRPHNLYCIHVDLKSNAVLHDLVRNLTIKYPNIILPVRTIEVVHSQFSVLESELLCMEALLLHKKISWKYFINLTGQELPLKTNLELVRILKQVKGANLMEKVSINPGRIPKSIGPPPHGIRIWKGAVHIVASRDFVRFALYDKRALDLLQYLRKTQVPDETYFSTLNHDISLQAPGGYNGNLTRDPILYPFLNRHKIWYTEGVCHGQFLRGICIFSMKDIPEMISNQNMKLFANKFVVGKNDEVSKYMLNWFRNRTRIVYSKPLENPFINLTYYSELTVVKNHFQSQE